MQLWICKYAEYSRTETPTGMIVQCFEVRDDEGRKVSDKNLIANLVKVLSLPVKIQGIVGTSHHSDAVAKMYLIQITSEMRAPLLLERLLVVLKRRNFQVYKPRSWSHNRHFEGAIYVKGGSIDDLMPRFLEDEFTTQVDCKMVFQKLASEDANLDLQNVQHCNLRAPRGHPTIRIQYGVGNDTHLAVKVECLDDQERLVDTACSLVKRTREVRILKEPIIRVQKFKKEGVNGTYFHDDGEGRFKDFVKIFLKQKWDEWDICLDNVDSERDLKDYLHYHLKEGKLELVYNFGNDFGLYDLMYSLWENGLYISKAVLEPHGNNKVLFTFFVLSEQIDR